MKANKFNRDRAFSYVCTWQLPNCIKHWYLIIYSYLFKTLLQDKKTTICIRRDITTRIVYFGVKSDYF